MGFLRTWSNPERWEWFAAGDETVSPPTPRSAPNNNSPQQLIFEIGLWLAAPLMIAALFSVLFGG